MSSVGRLDHVLLGVAFLVGCAGTLRAFGVGTVSLPAVLCVAGATLLALRPLLRIFRGAREEEPRERTLVAVILGVHIVATLFFFPPEDIANDRPVLSLDHALHFYQAERARACPVRALPGTVYDPHFMAGYPAGMVLDIDSKGVEAWCSLLRMLETARSYKLFILLTYLLLPICVYAGCRRLRFGVEESVYALLLFLVFWHWGRPYASHFRFAGMFSYVLSFQLSFYIIGLFRSLFEGERVRRLYLLGALAVFVHPAAVALLPVPIIANFFAGRGRVKDCASRRSWQRRSLLAVGLWATIVGAVNAFWLVPFLSYLGFDAQSTGYFQIGGLFGLGALLFKAGNLPALLLVACACVGTASLAKERRWGEGAAPAAGSAFLLILSAFGMHLPVVNRMEPGRFLVPALLFMAPLAGSGAAAAVGSARGLCRVPQAARWARAGVAVILLVSMPVLALVNARAFYRHTLATTHTPGVRALIDTLKKRTDPSGRLMIEDGPAWAYGNCLLPAMLPLETGVEQIGGPYPHGFLPHHFATFRTCEAFGKPLAEMEPELLETYLARYNVHWVLTATDECRGRVESLPFLELLWREGAFTLWEVVQVSSFVSEPNVVVEASYNLIHVSMAPEAQRKVEGPMLLKYHWDRRLEVSAPARISPLALPDDPVPLILLDPRGATDIRIVFR